MLIEKAHGMSMHDNKLKKLSAWKHLWWNKRKRQERYTVAVVRGKRNNDREREIVFNGALHTATECKWSVASFLLLIPIITLINSISKRITWVSWKIHIKLLFLIGVRCSFITKYESSKCRMYLRQMCARARVYVRVSVKMMVKLCLRKFHFMFWDAMAHWQILTKIKPFNSLAPNCISHFHENIYYA